MFRILATLSLSKRVFVASFAWRKHFAFCRNLRWTATEWLQYSMWLTGARRPSWRPPNASDKASCFRSDEVPCNWDTIAGPPQLSAQSADETAGRKTDEGSRLCQTAASLTHTSCSIHRTNFGTCLIWVLLFVYACGELWRLFLCAVYVHHIYSYVLTYLFTLCWPTVNSVGVYTRNYQLNSLLVSNFIVLLYSYWCVDVFVFLSGYG